METEKKTEEVPKYTVEEIDAKVIYHLIIIVIIVIIIKLGKKNTLYCGEDKLILLLIIKLNKKVHCGRDRCRGDEPPYFLC